MTTACRRLPGRVALVTGAGSGIGAATARRLAEEGATVVVADIDPDAAGRVAGDLGDDRLESLACELDVASRSAWDAAVARTRRECGGLDILVNNAGITRDRTLMKMTDDEWAAVIDVHLKGTWLGCQLAVPELRARGGGAIVNISSSGRHGAFGQTNYAAAKAGIVGLTKSVALEHARHGIRCNAVAPGVIDTPMTQAVPERVRDQWREAVALGRFGNPDELAAAVAFLASDDASYVSGHVLDVTGLELHP